MEDTRIAVLSIIVEDSESTAKLNEMIHDYAEYVVGRMGIPYREKNISIISLVIDAPQTKISELSGKIGRLSGVTAKAAYANVCYKEKSMIKIAVYGKGGIGKSTTVSNVAAVFASQGLRVMQIGCDPKADSTVLLRHGEKVETVLDLVRTRKEDFTLEEMVKEGFAGVCCVEAGGPSPGLGCAGRGIIAALETLEKKGAYEKYRPDVVIYDVLGDVVCGGFSMPMRRGYADKIFVITSGENMAIHAAANIAMAVENFKDRGYAQLGGLILNRRNVKNEDAKVEELAEDIHSKVIGTLSRSALVTDAEEQKKTVIEAYPDSEMAEEYRILAGKIRTLCGI